LRARGRRIMVRPIPLPPFACRISLPAMIFRHRFPAAAVGLLLALVFPAHADDKLTITLAPRGLAAGDKPLPSGGTVSVRVIVQNTGTSALARIQLRATVDGLKAENPTGWRIDGSGFSAVIARLAAGDRIERNFSARVDPPPPAPGTARIAVEARSEGGTANAEARIPVADCAGAYRSRLAPIRAEQIAAVRKLAEDIRKAEPGLPRGRIFPATGARTGPLANAERLAAQFAATAGADTELAKEGMRWLVLRWTAELGNYVTQDKSPGLCTGVSELLSIYRNSIAPLTRRLEAISAGAITALAAAREATKAEDDDLARMARRIAGKAGLEGIEDNASVFAILAKTRNFLAGKDKKLEADDARALSLTETATWLAAAGKRADGLGMAFSGTLAAIAAAHKDTCVCAY
jgi:hypothetical protein